MKRNFFNKATDTTCEMYIYSSIGESWWEDTVSAKSVLKAIDSMPASCTQLNVYVNSPGGDVFDAVAIYNLLKRVEANITMHVDGLAASAASLIVMAGDEIVMGINAMMMIHDPWSFALGNSAEMRKVADTLDTIRGTIVDTYVARTKQSWDKVSQMMLDETWINAEDCKTMGFCDSISSDVVEENVENKVVPVILAQYKKTPDALRTAAKSSRSALASMRNGVMKMKRDLASGVVR